MFNDNDDDNDDKETTMTMMTMTTTMMMMVDYRLFLWYCLLSRLFVFSIVSHSDV